MLIGNGGTRPILADGSRASAGNQKRSIAENVTAHTGSSQGDGPINTDIVQIAVCANPGDALTLPPAVKGMLITIENNGVNSADIFPATDDNINGGGVNVAEALPAGEFVTYYAIDGVNWSTLSKTAGFLDGSLYALLAGRSGSQVLIGGTGSGESLTLQSTAHATKGKILFGNSVYDEVNNRLGIRTANPDAPLHVIGAAIITGTVISQKTLGDMEGLISYYSFEGNADDQVGSNDGTVTAAMLTNDGRIGQAYKFDGANTWIDLGRPANLLFGTADFSISMWIKPNTITSEDYPLGNAEFGGPWADFHFRVQASEYRIMVEGVNTTGCSATVDEWAHLIVTRSGNIFTLYKDGVACGTTLNLSSDITSAGGNWFIGRTADAALPRPFDGTIDEVMFFNKALSMGERNFIYHEGLKHLDKSVDHEFTGDIDFQGQVKLKITDTDGVVKAQIWYDESEDKLKFKTAAGVETITST